MHDDRRRSGAGSSRGGMSTPWERKEKARAEKLKLIEDQVANGSLVIRPMTPEEKQENPVKPPRRPPRGPGQR
jgi:hypothetical protein